MKFLFLGILTALTFSPDVSWGSDCIKFENMEVRIINQQDDQVNLEWKARVINKCKKMIPFKVEIQFADNNGKRLESSFEHLNPIDPSEVRDIQGETSLLTETYYKTRTYYFKALELPNGAQ